MNPRVAAERPDGADIAALLAASEAFSAAFYPPESNHMVGLEALTRPEVTFLVARIAARPVGCGALVRAGDGSAELKRLFVAETARGTGIGRVLLDALEQQARDDGIRLIQLETGIHSLGALALYRRAGYAERGPFGFYAPDPLSVFMEKRLGGEA